MASTIAGTTAMRIFCTLDAAVSGNASLNQTMYIPSTESGTHTVEACNFENFTSHVQMCGFSAEGWIRGRDSPAGPKFDHTFGTNGIKNPSHSSQHL
jgi:hypothetical protein